MSTGGAAESGPAASSDPEIRGCVKEKRMEEKRLKKEE